MGGYHSCQEGFFNGLLGPGSSLHPQQHRPGRVFGPFPLARGQHDDRMLDRLHPRNGLGPQNADDIRQWLDEVRADLQGQLSGVQNGQT